MTNTYIKKDLSTFFNSPGSTSLLAFDFSNGGRGGVSVLNSALYITGNLIYSDTDSEVHMRTFDAAFRCAGGTVSQIGTTLGIVNNIGSGNSANVFYGFTISGTQILFEIDYSAGTPSATFHDFAMEGFLLT